MMYPERSTDFMPAREEIIDKSTGATSSVIAILNSTLWVCAQS